MRKSRVLIVVVPGGANDLNLTSSTQCASSVSQTTTTGGIQWLRCARSAMARELSTFTRVDGMMNPIRKRVLGVMEQAKNQRTVNPLVVLSGDT